MKTYLYDIMNRYKTYGDNLEVRTVLCNKSWCVFNHTGEKELYIFQEDGSLVISLCGRVTKATWQYISVNNTILIESVEGCYMFNPSFVDKVILVLQLEGTNQYSFMIDENNKALFFPKTISHITTYFEQKEALFLSEQRRLLVLEEDKRQKEAFLIKQHWLEQNNIRVLEEETSRKEAHLRIQREVEESTLNNNRFYKRLCRLKNFNIVIGIMFPIILFSCTFSEMITNFFDEYERGMLVLLFIRVGSVFLLPLINFLVNIYIDYRLYLIKEKSIRGQLGCSKLFKYRMINIVIGITLSLLIVYCSFCNPVIRFFDEYEEGLFALFIIALGAITLLPLIIIGLDYNIRNK